MTLPDGVKPEDLEAVYGYALSDVPAFGLKRAVEKLIKGEYDIRRGYIPKPPELAAMARAEAKVIRDDLTRLREKRATLLDLQKKPQPVSQDSLDRVRAMLGRFRADQEASAARHRGEPVSEPMTDEKAEYWRRIEALRDAPEVSADQRAFRRKIEMDLPEAKMKDAAE